LSCVIAGLLPAWKASKISFIEALRPKPRRYI